MVRNLCAPILAAALCAGPALGQAPAPKSAPRTAPAAATFDARDPAALVALLAELDAKAQMSGRSEDGVLVRVTSPAGDFQAQFAGCDAQGRACAAVQFDALAQRTATLAQINGYNQTSLTCRIFQDRAGKPHMLYSTLLFAGDTEDEMLGHVDAWRGCLATFGAFLADPTAYLASAP